jgi:ribokinase
MSARIAVLGSLNMDFVVRVAHLPAPGETILGRDFQMIPGGKGANQACAVGKLGAEPASARMIGRVGCDVFADHLRASLAAARVDVSAVRAAKGQPTGVALIWVDEAAQNSIVVAPGANHELRPGDVEAFRPVFRGASHVLFQLETPLATVERALAVAREEGAATMLDPAPAQPLSRELLSHVDILTPNESEACILLGRETARVGREEAAAMARDLARLGPRTVVVKLGGQGCLWWDGTNEVHAPAFSVKAVDATAAGDTFNAALAVALSEDREPADALRFANAAAAISVTRVGAQASIPSRAEVDAFLREAR